MNALQSRNYYGKVSGDNMRQAINVRYVAQTNHKPARWSASCAAKRIIRSEPMNIEGEYKCAIWIARTLAKELGWHGRYFGGRLKNGDYVFVGVDHKFAGDSQFTA